MEDLLKDGRYKSVITSGSHGENYHKEVALTLFLRMHGCSSSFRLAYEVEEADKFDDVVLIDDGRKEIHFIQVKHANVRDDEVKNIDLDALFPTAGKENNKGDFDLCKYIRSFLIVNHRFADGKSEEEYSRKYYVLTNKDLQIMEKNSAKYEELMGKVEERDVNEILKFPKSKARHLKLTPTENAIKKLGEQINKDFLEVEKAIEELFNSGKVGSVLKTYCTPLKEVLKVDKNKNCCFQESFRLESKQFSIANLYNKLKDKLDLTKQMKVQENFLQKNSRKNFLPPYISEDEIAEFFCSSFTLSVGHPNSLHPVIDSELRRWMKSCIRPDILGKLSKKEQDQVLIGLKKKFDELNEPIENKIKCALKNSDEEKCLEENRKDSKVLECEEAEELQGSYINRMIVYTAAEDPTDKIATKTDDSLSCTTEKTDFNFRDTIDRTISDNDFIGELRGTFKDHQHIVLVAEPGMGKTSLLRFLAFEVQKRNDVADVYLVYLSSLVKELDKVERISDLEGVLRVLSAVLSEESCEIIKNSPDQREDNSCSIAILFDGFDEIHSKYTDKVIEMLKQLTFKKSIQIIISSRIHIKQILESTFTLRSMVLQPFSEQDQISYLKKMWYVDDKGNEIFENYSKQLLDKFHSSIPSKLREISGLPLMMRMIAEIYSDRFQQYFILAKTSRVELVDFTKDNFNIVQLYEQFVRKCFHMKLVDKYKYCGDINDVEFDAVIEGYILEHQLLAMSLLDVNMFFYLTKNTHFKMKYDQFISRCERESEKSLLVKVVDNHVQFCHLSYGEYFEAKYLCDHIFTFEEEHVISIWSEHEVIRRLSMIKLGENEAFFEIVISLCQSNWKIALWACESGNLRMVSDLVSNYKSFSSYNLNMMLQVSAQIGHFEICRLLLNHDANPNGVDENQKTALHSAAENGHDRVVGLLLENHADVDARGNDEWAALHLAARYGHSTVVELLLRKKANVNAEGKDGFTALHLAAHNGHDKVVNLLLNNKASIDVPEQFGWTALHWAARKGHSSVVDLLLEKKANVNFLGTDYWTALHLAALNGHFKVVDLLLTKRANVDAQTRDGLTALHLAAHNGHALVVKLLIDNSADTELRTSGGKTPLDFAKRHGLMNVVKLLQPTD